MTDTPKIGALTPESIPLLQEGDVLSHATDGQLVYSGRYKISWNPARLEARSLGVPNSGWRMIPFTVLSFVSRPSLMGGSFA